MRSGKFSKIKKPGRDISQISEPFEISFYKKQDSQKELSIGAYDQEKSPVATPTK